MGGKRGQTRGSIDNVVYNIAVLRTERNGTRMDVRNLHKLLQSEPGYMDQFDSECLYLIGSAHEFVEFRGGNIFAKHLLYQMLQHHNRWLRINIALEDMGMSERSLDKFVYGKFCDSASASLDSVLNSALTQPCGPNGRDIFALAITLVTLPEIEQYLTPTDSMQPARPTVEAVKYYLQKMSMWDPHLKEYDRKRRII